MVEGTTSVTICSAADDSLSVTVPITVSGVYDPVTGKTSYTDADGNQTEVTDAHYKDYTYSVSMALRPLPNIPAMHEICMCRPHWAVIL